MPKRKAVIRMSFGTKFRILREKKGMPRTGCDEIFNLMHGTVSNWENGYREPEEELLPAAALPPLNMPRQQKSQKQQKPTGKPIHLTQQTKAP